MADISRGDQIVHRFHVKTVGVLAHARLAREREREPRIDKWFELPLPDYPEFRDELYPYRCLSRQPSAHAEHSSPSSLTLHRDSDSTYASLIPWAIAPPLLVAFTLDTSSIPAGKRLLWRNVSAGERITIDVIGQGGKGKGKGREDGVVPPQGIILERWTLRSLPSPQPSPPPPLSSSASYRAGTAHFRTLHPRVRQLPIQGLVDRLQRSDEGLRIGIKVWCATGYEGVDDGGIEDAWATMERGFIGLQVPLDSAASPPITAPVSIERHTFPEVHLINGLYQLDVQARRDVDFSLADDDRTLNDGPREEYFTPTLRHPPLPTSMQNPIHLASVQPIRGDSPVFSAGLTATRPNGPLHPPRPSFAQEDRTQSGRWSSTENLPFAVNPTTGSGSYRSERSGGARYGALQGDRTGTSASPIPASNLARRYSGLGTSGEPATRASPSLSSGVGLGISSRSSSSPIGGVGPGTSYERPSSFHRPSSYLSQSGRSFTHITPGGGGASLGNSGEQSRPRLQSLLSSPVGLSAATSGASASPGTPPFLGSIGIRASSSFSPTMSHSRPSSLGNRGLPSSLHATNTGSPTPPIPECHESGDDSGGSGQFVGPSISGASSRNIRRYSSSFGQQQQRRGASWLGTGSTTSSGDPGSLVFGASSRGEGRGSVDGFGMRRGSVTSLSRGRGTPSAAEKEAINDFLRTLDGLAQEPVSSMWDPSDSQAGSQTRSGTETTPDPQSGSNTSSAVYRKPLTKSQVDDALRRMAASYTPPFPPPSAGTSPRLPVLRPVAPATASPPAALERPLATSPQAMLQRHVSSVKSSSPLAGEPIRAHRIRSSLDTTASQSESTSASAASSIHDLVVEPLTFGKTRSAGALDKPCDDAGDVKDGAGRGESTEREKPRGTVLLRGGFQQFVQPPSSASREHSPLAATGSMSPVGSTKFLQSPRRNTEREIPTRLRHESERSNRSTGSVSERVVSPILSAGAQPLDRGVRSWTHRRPLGSNGGEDDEGDANPARNVMYTAPSSLESRRQQRSRDSRWGPTDDELRAPMPTFPEVGSHARRVAPNARRKTSDDGDDSIVGNLEMSGA